MEEIDGLIRGAAIGIMLLLATALIRARWRQPVGRVSALFVAGAIAYLLHPTAPEWPVLVRLLLGILALSCPFFFWSLARLIFDDGFAERSAHWALLALIVVAGLGQAIRHSVPVAAGKPARRFPPSVAGADRPCFLDCLERLDGRSG
jgi:hypothetical protein